MKGRGMRKEKLIIDFLIDKRQGRRDDYSIPEKTTFFPSNLLRHGRQVDSTGVGCSIPLQMM